VLKALGARSRDVLLLFVAEAALIGLAGGIIGTLGAVGLARMGNAAVDRLVQSVAGTGIIDDWFEAVTYLDAIFAFVRGEQQEHATIVIFAADAELFVKIDGILLDTFAFERVDGDDGHLRGGLLLEFGAEIFEAKLRPGFDHAGKIGDIARRTNVFDFFCGGAAKKNERKKRKNQ